MQATDTPERLDRYEARLRAIPAYLDAWGDVAREGIADGVTSPRLVTERAVAQLERLLSLAPEDSPATRAARARTPPRTERIAGVVRDIVNPAFARYRDTLREYLPHCHGDDRPLGAPGRRRDVRDVESSRGRPCRSTRATCMPSGSSGSTAIQEERVRDRGSPGIRRTPPRRSRRIRRAARHTASSPRRAVGVGPRTGRAELGGIAARGSDACRARTARSGRSRSSGRRTCRSASTTRPPRTARAAARTTSTRTTCPSRPLHHIASRHVPRGEPGPSLPDCRSSRSYPTGPRLRRFGGLLAGSAFAEGWGLYSERLAEEMGLYLDDWERLGMLESSGAARRPVGHRHRDPRARMVARARHRHDGGDRHAAHRRGHRGRSLHRDARRRRSAT